MTHDREFYADRPRLMRMDRKTGKHEEWLGNWDLIPLHWEYAADGSVLFEAEHEARQKLFTWNGQGEPRAITGDGSASSVTPVRGGRVAYLHATLAGAPELHVMPQAGGPTTRITDFTGPTSAGFATGEVREMTFEGSHGEAVQMFVVLPVGYVAGKKYPLVHMIHGGPHGTFGDVWHPRWNAQAFAAPGYVVALVNFQGSTSWGQDFAQRIQGEWAARPAEDILKATDTLIATGLVDESRMAITGGSYGGYMVSWLAGHTDRFKCIVNHAGVADLTAQYASDVTQGRGKAAGGEAWDGLEKQDLWSPVRFAKGMNTPMLGDPRRARLSRAGGAGTADLRIAQGQGCAGAARVLPRREPLGAQGEERAAVAARGARLAGAVAQVTQPQPDLFESWQGRAAAGSASRAPRRRVSQQHGRQVCAHERQHEHAHDVVRRTERGGVGHRLGAARHHARPPPRPRRATVRCRARRPCWSRRSAPWRSRAGFATVRRAASAAIGRPHTSARAAHRPPRAASRPEPGRRPGA
jgi:hypothetical protein